MLDAEITIEEIITTLKKCKNNKSPGADEINSEFLKASPENEVHFINMFFNKILKQEKVLGFLG